MADHFHSLLNHNKQVTDVLEIYARLIEGVTLKNTRVSGTSFPFPTTLSRHSVQREKFLRDHLASLSVSRYEWIEVEDSILRDRLSQGVDMETIGQELGRSSTSCRIRFSNHLSPDGYFGPWTRQEEILLVDTVHRSGGKDWQKLAEIVQTKRTALQCFQRYQRSLNPSLASSDFTEVEDSSLSGLVNQFASGCWVAITARLGGAHTAEQCARRWRQVLRTGLSQGRWTPEEDAKLMKLVRIFGSSCWSEIALHFTSRTDVQIRERWQDVLRPGLRGSVPWSTQEDRILLDAVDDEGVGSWTKVSRRVPGRTDHQCATRFLILAGTDAVSYKEGLKLKKLIFKRSRAYPMERPQLSQADFL